LRLRAIALALRVGLAFAAAHVFRCSTVITVWTPEKFQENLSQTVAAVYDRRRFPAVYDRCYSKDSVRWKWFTALQRLFIWPEPDVHPVI